MLLRLTNELVSGPQSKETLRVTMTYSMLDKVKETLPHSTLGEEKNWDKTYWTKRDKQTAPHFSDLLF